MIVTIALITFLASIAAFFAQEFGRMFKKLFAIPGMKLLLPLALASWLIIVYEEWGLWLLLRAQIATHQLVHRLHALVPFEQGSLPFIKIIFLFLIASLPIWCFELAALRKGRRKRIPRTYWIGWVLWVIAAILLTLSSVPQPPPGHHHPRHADRSH